MQETAFQVAALTLGAGSAMAVGGALAMIERIHPTWLEREFRHTVIAFGGGALLSAVSLVLVPEGTRTLTSPGLVALWMTLGGLAFLLIDIALHAKKTPAAQLAAMLADFVPEALAMGAAFAHGDSAGPVLALLIGLQNLPEGFNAYRELTSGAKMKPRTVLTTLILLAWLGPIAGLTGLWYLAGYPRAVAAIMLFAAGGILYLTFQDIAPQAWLEQHWAPPLGAVAGFVVGLIGQMVIAPH